MIIPTRRMEVFSDSVIAIAITIMVIEIETGDVRGATLGSQWDMLMNMLPSLSIYLLSFIMLGIMWISHHHMCHILKHVDITLLWHNMHLLFWLTLVPVATSTIGKYPELPLPVAFYGFTMFMASLAFGFSRRYAVTHNLIITTRIRGLKCTLNQITKRRQIVVNIGLCLYFFSIPLSFVYIPLSYFCFIVPTVLYMVPDEVRNTRLSRILLNIFKKKELS
jgi:uncharacterized membrane protein